MSKHHTFSKFKELTESCKFEHEQSRQTVPSFTEKLEIGKAEHCRILALSEIINISKDELINILLSSALGDAHEGFLNAFCDENERHAQNQQLKKRVKELLALY